MQAGSVFREMNILSEVEGYYLALSVVEAPNYIKKVPK